MWTRGRIKLLTPKSELVNDVGEDLIDEKKVHEERRVERGKKEARRGRKGVVVNVKEWVKRERERGRGASSFVGSSQEIEYREMEEEEGVSDGEEEGEADIDEEVEEEGEGEEEEEEEDWTKEDTKKVRKIGHDDDPFEESEEGEREGEGEREESEEMIARVRGGMTDLTCGKFMSDYLLFESDGVYVDGYSICPSPFPSLPQYGSPKTIATSYSQVDSLFSLSFSLFFERTHTHICKLTHSLPLSFSLSHTHAHTVPSRAHASLRNSQAARFGCGKDPFTEREGEERNGYNRWASRWMI